MEILRIPIHVYLLLFFVVGIHLATLPIDPKVGKMLILGAIFQCLSSALIMATTIVYQNPFVSLIEHLDEAKEARSRLANNAYRYNFKNGKKKNLTMILILFYILFVIFF